MSQEVIEVTEREVEVIEIVERGPQGPQGATGSGLGTLTTQGDTLYQGASSAQRLPIGTAGQILKVNAGGTAPEWGAAPAAGVSSVNGETGAVTLDAADVGAAASSHTHAASAITSGTLTHERGGLEADVSSYNGLVKIASGSTSAVTVTSAGEALLDDADAAAQRTTLGLGTAATEDTTDFAAATHAASHAAGGTDELFDQNLNILDSVTFSDVFCAGLLADGTLQIPSSNDSCAVTPQGLQFVGTAAANTLSNLGAAASGAITTSGLTQASARLLGRTTASTGAVEEITVGAGLSLSAGGLSATASGGSKTYAVFTALDNNPPSTAFMTLDTRNSVPCLDADDATDESAVFVGIIPEGASLGSGLKIRLHWAATTATSGDVRWDVQLERMTTDLDSDSFDTIASATATTNGASGILTVTEITLTTIDSVTAGDGFRLKVTRDANNAADTMSGDCELYICEVRSAA